MCCRTVKHHLQSPKTVGRATQPQAALGFRKQNWGSERNEHYRDGIVCQREGKKDAQWSGFDLESSRVSSAFPEPLERDVAAGLAGKVCSLDSSTAAASVKKAQDAFAGCGDKHSCSLLEEKRTQGPRSWVGAGYRAN